MSRAVFIEPDISSVPSTPSTFNSDTPDSMKSDSTKPLFPTSRSVKRLTVQTSNLGHSGQVSPSLLVTSSSHKFLEIPTGSSPGQVSPNYRKLEGGSQLFQSSSSRKFLEVQSSSPGQISPNARKFEGGAPLYPSGSRKFLEVQPSGSPGQVSPNSIKFADGAGPLFPSSSSRKFLDVQNSTSGGQVSPNTRKLEGAGSLFPSKSKKSLSSSSGAPLPNSASNNSVGSSATLPSPQTHFACIIMEFMALGSLNDIFAKGRLAANCINRFVSCR